MEHDKEIKQASRAAMLSLGNMTLIPAIGFVLLLLMGRRDDLTPMGRYHINFGIKLNLWAFAALFLVSTFMLLLGGFSSPLAWVYVISYFTLVHTLFILVAVWALVRAWSGQEVARPGSA